MSHNELTLLALDEPPRLLCLAPMRDEFFSTRLYFAEFALVVVGSIKALLVDLESQQTAHIVIGKRLKE